MKPGDKMIFTSSATIKGHPGYPEKSNQLVTVVRELDQHEVDKEEVGPIWKIKFEDGSITDAFEDELTEPTQEMLDAILVRDTLNLLNQIRINPECGATIVVPDDEETLNEQILLADKTAEQLDNALAACARLLRTPK